MRAEVDPDERDSDDGELREPVRDRGRLDQEAGALDGCCSVSSIIAPRRRWKSMIHSPFANARLTPSGRPARGRPGRRSRSRSRSELERRDAPSRAAGCESSAACGEANTRPTDSIGPRKRCSAADVAHLHFRQRDGRLRAALGVAVGALAPDPGDASPAPRPTRRRGPARAGRARGCRRDRCRGGPRPRSASACSRRRTAA